jgi:hypothetical protein
LHDIVHEKILTTTDEIQIYVKTVLPPHWDAAFLTKWSPDASHASCGDGSSDDARPSDERYCTVGLSAQGCTRRPPDERQGSGSLLVSFYRKALWHMQAFGDIFLPPKNHVFYLCENFVQPKSQLAGSHSK